MPVTLAFTSSGAAGSLKTTKNHTLELSRRLAVVARNLQEIIMGILWTIIIGFVAGVIAKFIMPGDNEPSGFILTTILGIVGAFVATFLGQALGWYGPNQGAGLIGAVVGAIVVLAIYGFIQGRRSTTTL